MKRTGFIWLVGCVLLLSAGTVWAQGKFSVQFDETPLNRVLDAFRRFDPNLQFTLAPNLGDIRITASLVDVTVDAAMGIVLDQAGLRGVKDNGVYQISEKPEAKGERTVRPAPRFTAPIFSRASTPTEGADVTAGAAPGAATAAAGASSTSEEEDLPLRLIIIKFADPWDIADLFGGDVIEGGGMSGGGGSGSSGGYGSSGSSGSSRGGRGSSGSDSGSSSRSSRGSSSSSGSSRSSRSSSY
ncbi:hypothetical protein LLH23_02100 [bacterium]|nr:hypothetical protein [bacterium]